MAVIFHARPPVGLRPIIGRNAATFSCEYVEKEEPSRIPVDEQSSVLSRGVSQLSEQCSHKNLVLSALIERLIPARTHATGINDKTAKKFHIHQAKIHFCLSRTFRRSFDSVSFAPPILNAGHVRGEYSELRRSMPVNYIELPLAC
ncbi:hypothetical protein TcasGA2_TC007899 [Tribolium castaneum]|uniref:Uncharacterized protein n=1 Tax=Tribolium castaneum TaxID=7070 RepID=D2A2Y3_TRICA|nr:hypothetical protein TcasGA2_TC007899 [Tribolium castaneum]